MRRDEHDEVELERRFEFRQKERDLWSQWELVGLDGGALVQFRYPMDVPDV